MFMTDTILLQRVGYLSSSKGLPTVGVYVRGKYMTADEAIKLYKHKNGRDLSPDSIKDMGILSKIEVIPKNWTLYFFVSFLEPHL